MSHTYHSINLINFKKRNILKAIGFYLIFAIIPFILLCGATTLLYYKFLSTWAYLQEVFLPVTPHFLHQKLQSISQTIRSYLSLYNFHLWSATTSGPSPPLSFQGINSQIIITSRLWDGCPQGSWFCTMMLNDIESWNHGMVCTGRDLINHLIPNPAMGRDTSHLNKGLRILSYL